MAQNPPQELRGVLERQIQDLNQQLGEAGQGAAAAPAAGVTNSPAAAASAAAPAQQRVIRASITISPQIQQQLGTVVPLFVLARDPAAGGPPLAVQRRTSAEIPLTIELSERDAMVPTHTIASVPRVQVVARLSRSGAPQASSGDFYGQADYDFSKDAGTLHIVIDRTVP
jgi:cytochrome c-type biogenesis protein CcmH